MAVKYSWGTMDWHSLNSYQLLIEYKNMAFKPHKGLYIMPQLDNLYIWYGCYFKRESRNQGSITKFFITIPSNYPQSESTLQFITAPSKIIGTQLKHLDLGKLVDIFVDTVEEWPQDDEFVQNSKLNLSESIPPLNPIKFKPGFNCNELKSVLLDKDLEPDQLCNYMKTMAYNQ